MVAMVTGSFAGLSATAASAATTPACTATRATGTCTVSLGLTSGTFAPQGNTPKALPSLSSPAFTGIESSTGSIRTATVTIPTMPQSNTGTTETVKIYQKTMKAATGTINPQGAVTIGATLLFEIDVTEPVTQQCVTEAPSHVLLQSTSAYDATTEDVAVAAAPFTIPAFTSKSGTSCAIAASTATKRFSGSVGNVLTLDLHGPLAVPSAALPTSTALTVSPNTPPVMGQSVTLTATITATTSGATKPTGTIEFLNGTTVLNSQQVVSGTTVYHYSTTSLPAGTAKLTAVYWGGTVSTGARRLR